jgi:hypothetical protein
MSIKRQSITFPDIRFEDERLNRLMQFIRAQAAELQRMQQMLRSGAPGQVLEKSTSADYDAAWQDAGGSAAITGAENVGAGEGVFQAVTGTSLAFKSLIEGANITLTAGPDSITISASSSAPGGGTVTSVAISSADLTVTGSPIEDAGVIELEITDHAVTYTKLQETSADAVVLGRRSGEGAGEVEELSSADLLAILGLSSSSGYPPQLAYAGIV